jgi:hypothetical protein
MMKIAIKTFKYHIEIDLGSKENKPKGFTKCVIGSLTSTSRWRIRLLMKEIASSAKGSPLPGQRTPDKEKAMAQVSLGMINLKRWPLNT